MSKSIIPSNVREAFISDIKAAGKSESNKSEARRTAKRRMIFAHDMKWWNEHQKEIEAELKAINDGVK